MTSRSENTDGKWFWREI